MSADLYREYGVDELGADGYPPVWHQTIKHDVRATAGHRCVRCGHPYRTGAHPMERSDDKDGAVYVSWSPCDEGCRHDGPIRWSPVTERTEARARILTVHHLDGNKANCRWWNLAALCQRCHLRVQGKVVMARVWPWEHSAWFKPYVAGYYAHVYLGEALGRDEVAARLDELLALERAA